MNVTFDELSAMAFKQRCSKPGLQNLLFEAMYDDYIGGQPSATARTILAAQEPQVHQTSTASTSIADTAPTPTNSSSLATNFPNTSKDVDELNPQQQHVSNGRNKSFKVLQVLVVQMLFHIIVKDKRTMDNTIDQQVALVEALVPHATATLHHHSIRFKMNNKKRIVNLEYFREMLYICPRIPNQLFDELPFEEEILSFLRNLGHNGEIKKITDVNINKLHQPWRSFAAVINKCLSGKSTVEHKDAMKSNEMYYPRFTKVIVNFFMTKDPSIPRRNKVNWHYVRDDQMFTTIKLVLRHQNTKQFNAILPVELTNGAIRNSAAYKEYYAIASGAEPPKTKASVRKTQSSSDTTMPPPVAKGTRIQTLAKVDKPAKGKQPAKSSTAKGPTVLSEVALTKDEQKKLATKRSLTQTHISQASGSGADEGTGLILGVPDVPTYKSDEEISWKSSDEDDDDDMKQNEDIDDQSDDESHDDQEDDDFQDDDDDQTDSDNDGDDFVHTKFSTHDEEAKDEECFDPIVQTPFHVENSDDEGNDDASHGMNVGGDEGPDAEDDDNELYGDLNINLEGRDVQMTDVHTTQVLEDTHMTLTLVNPDGQQQSLSVSSQFVLNMLNPSLDTGIDSLFESTHRVDVPVMTTVEPLLLTAPTLLPPSIPIISQVQQAPAPSPATAPSTSLQDLLNFGSLFGFDHQLKTLEANFSEFMQTNQFAEAVSSIPGIVDRYLDHRMNEAVKVAIINEKVKERVKVQVFKILPKIEKNVNEQLEVKVLTCASNSSKTSYAVVVDLSEVELKKILIEKMESNKSIHRSNQQKNLYKALVEAYEWSKRRRAGKEPESTSAPKEKASKTFGKSTEGSKSHQKTASESAPAEEPMQTTQDLEEPEHLEFEIGAANDQPVAEASQHIDCDLAKQADSRTSFNELMDTPVDFSAFMMNRLKVDTLTPELLAGSTYELMKGSCKSLVELDLFLEEVYKATTDQLDCNNPKGQQYPHDLLKPLPLIPNSRGRRVIPFDHFINNNLECLCGGASSRKYTTSVTKTKETDYGHIKWIEDLVPRTMWSQVPVSYDKYDLWGICDLKRLCIQDIEDMLLLLVQGKLTNLTVEERFAFNGIRMKYLPQTICRRRDKERAAAMIQAIDKLLKTMRIMQSLENFVGGRLYEGDFRMLQRTI
nr:hypothetical protein [Tanacetum cinerariifolium]